MVTYLGFKRNFTDNETGMQLTETKFVPVNIPELDSRDGWKLIGSSDIVNVVPSSKPNSPVSFEQLTIDGVALEDEVSDSKTQFRHGDSFQSNIPGTAKLVRANGSVFIAYRKGKKTLNETSPNSVCISDATKDKFFKDCRLAYVCDQYRFSSGCKEYEFWNKFMDEEYNRQLNEANRLKA